MRIGSENNFLTRCLRSPPSSGTAPTSRRSHTLCLHAICDMSRTWRYHMIHVITHVIYNNKSCEGGGPDAPRSRHLDLSRWPCQVAGDGGPLLRHTGGESARGVSVPTEGELTGGRCCVVARWRMLCASKGGGTPWPLFSASSPAPSPCSISSPPQGLSP